MSSSLSAHVYLADLHYGSLDIKEMIAKLLNFDRKAADFRSKHSYVYMFGIDFDQFFILWFKCPCQFMVKCVCLF